MLDSVTIRSDGFGKAKLIIRKKTIELMINGQSEVTLDKNKVLSTPCERSRKTVGQTVFMLIDPKQRGTELNVYFRNDRNERSYYWQLPVFLLSSCDISPTETTRYEAFSTST